MASQTEPEIVFYDLASVKNVCFSPTTWRIRLILNYKSIPYKTEFLEFPDIAPTLKGFGIQPDKQANGSPSKYTVPAIHHIPTNTYIMDTIPIAAFLESTYPSPPLILDSAYGHALEARLRAVVGKATWTSIVPREVKILSPRSAAYFRRTREAVLGHPLEDLLEPPEKEERMYEGLQEGMRELSEALLRNREEGPFVLGKWPSITDFFVAGALQSTRTIDERAWERRVEFEGFRAVYEACEGWMERKD
ncbi:hypothetical protein K491DRAFT_689885 [Lophiostoma macrostomum CBS 122681]|uniref:Uncharacterized protein n=1 Tax=Lophiostoma macrostomum CBS 122681 TaxID=1314788 RepID=A0A6A6TH98_9PLEO|nr:hypothetical protein K491DRAFT_689885 [Lophiostoma macrostomum CBS 122681]